MDWGAFWSALLATGIVGGILLVGLKFLLDSQLERQKKELAKELYEGQLKLKIGIESQLAGIDALHDATLAMVEGVNNYEYEVEKVEKEARDMMKDLRSDLAEASKVLGFDKSEESKRLRILPNVEEIKQFASKQVHKATEEYALPKLTLFLKAFSYASARMEKEQRDTIMNLGGGFLLDFKNDKKHALNWLSELMEYLEAESRRLRGIEVGHN